ncbi:hypothetical protein PAECIP111893_01235 [Paenibacillus plantiphilus]|uniref:Uncharacterized protein n=1 Tax=Paenibacillus plantiphilus TaxID=2905650 RepID=A0ABM9C041_9BACL|nr:hypothetical protein PAECIP111893_01235 [Paenibacillus plantiphilus]
MRSKSPSAVLAEAAGSKFGFILQLQKVSFDLIGVCREKCFGAKMPPRQGSLDIRTNVLYYMW